MNLHDDKNAFFRIIENINISTGFRMDALEKDYYIVLFLLDTATKQKEGLPVYFKGGTALYKALKTINRFSEDIDLSVDTRGCTNSQNKKRLEKAAKKFSSLPRNRSLSKSNRSEVITVYDYVPITPYDKEDTLQRFGKLKVEATSFTISEPFMSLSVSPLLYDFSNDEIKHTLETRYDVKPFNVLTITLERIFVDKLFAAESYFRKSDDFHYAFETAKHIYDLAVMKDDPRIRILLGNPEQLHYLLQIRVIEERERLDGIPGIMPRNFYFLSVVNNDKRIQSAFSEMQRQYVLERKYWISYRNIIVALKDIKNRLDNNSAWFDSYNI